MENRVHYLDCLRVAATFAIVFLHVGAVKFDFSDVNGFEWQVLNFYESIVRWAVPVFVMISGAIFLGKDIPASTMFRKYIFKMARIFVFWSILYCLLQTRSLKLKDILEGNFHMWFILMIIGLYFCVPILREITRKKFIAGYFLGLAFIFVFLIPEFIMISRDFFGNHFRQTISSMARNVSVMNLSLVSGFSSYFVLGKVLNEAEITPAQRRIIYLLGVVSLISAAFLNSAVSMKNHRASQNYFQWIALTTLFESAAVFVFFKQHSECGGILKKIVSIFSSLSLGVYLIHIAVLNVFTEHGITALSFSPIISVPLISLVVFSASCAISLALKKIPFIGKYFL